MAGQVRQQATGQCLPTSPGCDVDMNADTLAGSAIIVRVVITGNTETVSQITDTGSNTYRRAIATDWGSGAFFGRAETWYAQNATAMNGINVLLSGSQDIGFNVTEVTGLVQSGTLVAITNEATSASDTTVRSGAITPDGRLFFTSVITGPFDLGGGNPGTPTNGWVDSRTFDGSRVGVGGTRSGVNLDGALEDIRVYNVASPNGGHIVGFKETSTTYQVRTPRIGRGARG